MNNFTQTVFTFCKNYFKKSLALVVLVTLLFGNLSFGQNYYNLSSGDYSETFTSWTTPATGINWSSVAIITNGTIPIATTTTVSSNSFTSTTTGGLQNGNTNIQFLSTGTPVNTTSVAFDLNMNFTNRLAGNLSYDVATVFNGSGNREASLKVYYSLNGSSWVELIGTNLPYVATNNVTENATVNIVLPAALNGQPIVKFRFYNYNGNGNGSNGSRPKISIDNVLVTSVNAATVDFANVQFPTSQTIDEGNTFQVFAQAYEPGLTEAAGQGTGLTASIGYSLTNTNPNTASWTWVPATFNVQSGNNDEFVATIGTGITPGTRYYASRFQINSGAFVYGGVNGNWNNDSAVLTVNSNLVDFANIQFPQTATITQGGSVIVYGRVFEPGFTVAAGANPAITAWIGTSATNTNPNTASWTWNPATFNVQAGNDDEYQANIGAALPAGTHYYASRFQKAGTSEFRYGGTNGNWNNDSAVLTINAAVPVVTSASQTGTVATSFSYQIVATNSPTSYALVGGNFPVGLTLNTTTGLLSGTPTTAGTYSATVTASNSGGTSAPATLSFTINPANQTITFAALPAVTYGAVSGTLTATATSGLPVAFASDNTSVATIFGTTINYVGAGTANITASQAGNANYNAAANVVRVLTVNSKNLTIIGVVANNKVQDGSTTATLSGTPTLNGIETIDLGNVSVSGTPIANFASALLGTGIAVTVTGYTLSGPAASKYTVSQPSGLTANITGLGTPGTIAASGILQNSFNANWNAVAGATSYVLDVSTSPTFGTATNASDLFFSEYVEGSSNNKYIEIYNGTGSNVDLANYELRSYSNGSASISNSTILSGILANNSTIVYRNGGALVYGGVSTSSAAVNFNGNDALALFKISTASNVDIFGRIGEDPGTAWTSGGFSTLDKTLVRNSSISAGVTVNPTSGFPTLSTQWIQNNIDTVTNLGSHTYNAFTPSFVTGYNALNVGNVTTYPVTGLLENTTYYYRVRAVNGTVTSANSNTTSATTKPAKVIWNGTSWSNTTGPDADIEAEIQGAYNTSAGGVQSPFTAKKVTITSSPVGSLIVASGTNVTVVNELINNGSATAVIIQNNANLIQSTNVANTGNITVRRNSSALRRQDYTLWSSPVAGQNLLSFSPLTLSTRFYTYETNATPTPNVYVPVASPSTAAFEQGKGYLIRTPNNHPTFPTIYNGSFTGVPTNGTVPATLTNNGVGQRFNAVGNPYPSTVSMASFVAANRQTGDERITGTLYFWRKTNNVLTTPGYCTWNSGTFVSNGEAQVVDPNGILQVGQGFIVEAEGAATQLNFTNAMRVASNNNQFFKNSAITTAEPLETNRIWLNMTSATGDFSQMAVGYMTNATQGVDTFDGKFFNDGPIAIASYLDNNQYVIQGRALPFEPSDVVPLNVKATTAGTYTIAIDHVDGLFTGGAQAIYLKDNLTASYTNLNTTPYAFTTVAGSFNNRFELVYQTALSTTNPTLSGNSVIVYKQNNAVVINTGSVAMESVKVFDIRGRLLVEKTNINAAETTLNVGTVNQILLLKITSIDGVVVTKKIVN